jgi:hypothetical protein
MHRLSLVVTYDGRRLASIADAMGVNGPYGLSGIVPQLVQNMPMQPMLGPFRRNPRVPRISRSSDNVAAFQCANRLRNHSKRDYCGHGNHAYN